MVLSFISSFLSLVIYPLGASLVLLAGGIAVSFCGFYKAGMSLSLSGFVLLFLASSPWVSDRLCVWLEDGYAHEPASSAPQAQAIVVMGGGVRAGPPAWPYPDLQGSADRYWHAARLFHANRADLIVVSGGRGASSPHSLSAAEAGKLFLRDLGVPDDRIVLENEAMNTRDNAVLVAEVLAELNVDRFLLVTSAIHMRRAEASFRSVGLEPIPAATDFSGMKRFAWRWRNWVPSMSALHNTQRAIHEIVGYRVYRNRGWVLREG